MVIKKVKAVVCDMDGCNNLTEKQILFNENNKVGLNLCDDCLKSLYDLMAESTHLKGGKYVKRKI